MGQGYNHYENCSCGWCSSDQNTNLNNAYLGNSKNANSYLNPNAKCPVCSAQVFFYRSPYDGRVFFDDLAPLWTKHPCTDNSKNIIYLTESERISKSEEIKKDYKNWDRFLFLSGTSFLDANRVLITGYLESDYKRARLKFDQQTQSKGNGMKMYLKFQNYGPITFRLFVEGKNWFINKNWIFKLFPVYLRKSQTEDWHFELSTFFIEADTITKLDAIAYIPSSDRK